MDDKVKVKVRMIRLGGGTGNFDKWTGHPTYHIVPDVPDRPGAYHDFPALECEVPADVAERSEGVRQEYERMQLELQRAYTMAYNRRPRTIED